MNHRKTNGIKNIRIIVFTRKSFCTSQHGVLNTGVELMCSITEW